MKEKRGSYKGIKDNLLIFSSSVNVIFLSGYSVLSDPSPTLPSQVLLLLTFAYAYFEPYKFKHWFLWN